MLTVGLIGFGTIGKQLVEYIRADKAGDVELKKILVRDRNKGASFDPSLPFEEDPERFFSSNLDLIVEAAGHEAVKRYAVPSLTSGSDFLVVSVGAFSDEELYHRALEAAKQHGRRLIFPSAAIGGLDRIAAGSVDEMEEITLTTRKPPRAWYGTIVEKEVDLERVAEPLCVFEGPARESARRFPENTNVSAALSLAGIGLDRTRVRVFVDPNISQNVHELSAKGKFGHIEVKIKNTPSENPKTGYIVAMSIAKVLKNLSTSVVIGL